MAAYNISPIFNTKEIERLSITHVGISYTHMGIFVSYNKKAGLLKWQ